MSKKKYFAIRAIRTHARELRRNQTDSEKILWEQLRNRRLSGYKFLRQHPIIYRNDFTGVSYFIADFYCEEKRTVVELDGPIHEKTEEYDQFRDEEMKFLKLNVLRINNDELEDLAKVLNEIQTFLNSIK